MQRAYFLLCLVLLTISSSAQVPFDRYAFAETGLNGKLIFPQADGSYVFAGENGTEYADTPVLAAFSPQGALQWRNDFEPYETWYRGPQYVFPTAAGELLVMGNYGFECDVILPEGLKIVRIDRQTGQVLDPDYYLPVHELSGAEGWHEWAPFLADYHPASDRFLLGQGDRFLLGSPAQPLDSVRVLPLSIATGSCQRALLIGADSLLLAVDSLLLSAHANQQFPQKLTVFPGTIQDVLVTAQGYYVLAASRLWYYSAQAGTTELAPTPANRLSLSGDSLWLYEDVVSAQLYHLGTGQLGGDIPLPEGLADFRIVGDRYYLVGNHSLGKYLPSPNGYVQTGPLSALSISGGWDIAVEEPRMDEVTYLGLRNGYFDSLDYVGPLHTFRAKVSFRVRNNGPGRLHQFTFRWEPRWYPFGCGLTPDWKTYEGLDIAPGATAVFSDSVTFQDIDRPSGIHRFSEGFCIDIPNNNIDLQRGDNCGIFLLTDASNPAPVTEQLSIFPNPATMTWQLAWQDAAFAEYRLFDTYGRPIQWGQLPAGVTNWRLSAANLPAGVYVLQLTDRSGRSLTHRLIRR
jgi:hypothetical protein